MKFIDLETFPRRSHYEFFKSYAYPYMGITANVDVTGLYDSAKAMGGSPFLAFLWAAATAANSIPEMRQRIIGDRIAQYDHCDTAHTVALPDGTFVNCRTDCRRSFAEFQTYGKQCQEEAKGRHGFVQPGEDETSLIFVSSTPWITFTQAIQPTPIPADSNVRIVFGKFFDQNGRKMLPVNIQCNHALVDGLHVGRFFQKFQELSDSDLTAVPRESDSWRKNVLRSDEISVLFNEDNEKYPVFGSQYRREQIGSVNFLDTLEDMPEEAWDVSEDGNCSVMAWVESNGGMYDLYIAAEGGMQAGVSCWKIFAGYVHAKHIRFGHVLHTTNVQYMRGMFEDCKALTNLDLSGFDTSNVRDMSRMLFDCKALTDLDLSNFDTSNVQDMSWMFNGCKALTDLDLSNFDISNVQDMSGMFDGCKALSNLDLSNFDTSNVQHMIWMFDDCPAGYRWEHLLH